MPKGLKAAPDAAPDAGFGSAVDAAFGAEDAGFGPATDAGFGAEGAALGTAADAGLGVAVEASLDAAVEAGLGTAGDAGLGAATAARGAAGLWVAGARVATGAATFTSSAARFPIRTEGATQPTKRSDEAPLTFTFVVWTAHTMATT